MKPPKRRAPRRHPSRKPKNPYSQKPPSDPLGNALAGLLFAAIETIFPDLPRRPDRQISPEEMAWRRALGFVDVPGVTKKMVLERFRGLAREHHPDQKGDHESFLRLVAARDAALRYCESFGQ